MRRAFTLVELIVSVALLGLVMALTTEILGPPLSLWEQSRARADLEQRSVIVETRLASELRATDAATLSVSVSPPGFCFAAFDPVVPYDPDTGKPRWTSRIAYVLDTDNNVLYRKTDAIASGGAALLGALDLAALLGSENGTERAVVSYIVGLDVSAPASGEVRVEMRYAWPHDRGVEVVRRVVDARARNG